MKKFLFSQKSLFLIFMFAGGGVLMSGCGKNDLIPDQTVPCDSKTRASSEFHWRCPDPMCGFLNSYWHQKCLICGKDYSEPHGYLLTDLLKTIKTQVKIGPNFGATPDIIELPSGDFLLSQPEEWYETSCALKYYNNLKNSSTYRLTPGYAEGVDFAWFRTTHVLFPKYHNVTNVERIYDRFRLNEGRNLTGFKGQGILDGSKAAIEAFAACR